MYIHKAVTLAFHLCILKLGLDDYANFTVAVATSEIISALILVGSQAVILRIENIDQASYFLIIIIKRILFLTPLILIINFYLDDFILTSLLISATAIVKIGRSYCITVQNYALLNLSFMFQSLFLFLATAVSTLYHNSFNYLSVFVLNHIILASAIIILTFILALKNPSKLNLLASYKKDSLVFCARDIIGLISAHLGKILLFYFGFVSASGALSFAQMLHTHSLSLIAPINHYFRPKIRNLYISKDSFRLKRLMAQSFLLSTLLGVVVGAAIFAALAFLTSFDASKRFGIQQHDIRLILDYWQLISVATLAAFVTDTFGVWSMLRFDGVRKKVLMVTASVGILSIILQVFGFLQYSEVGILYAIVIVTCINGLLSMFIFRLALLLND